MKNNFLKTIFLFAVAGIVVSATLRQQPVENFTLVIHGGAGALDRSKMTPEKEKAYKDKLHEALLKGHEILRKGGTSLDAVEAAVMTLEDSPLFNAGRGSVFTNAGTIEMDAAIMDGKTLKAGAIASVRTIRNPITAARAVMDRSKHVMLIGRGAEEFARQQGLAITDTSYFFTQERWDDLMKIKNKEQQKKNGDTTGMNHILQNSKYGTVGAVALDKHGNLAAATSTGGMTNKRWGRVGDVPVIGAGTYANNNSCAVSCTGWGEYFIRGVVAHDISALVEYKGMSVQAAAEEVLKKVARLGGDGGLIAVDTQGNITMPFNSQGMYRGYIKADGKFETAIY